MKVHPHMLLHHWGRQKTYAWTTGEKKKVVEHLISTNVHPLPLSLCCASWEPWLINDPSTVPSIANCMPSERHEESVHSTDGCICHRGNTKQTLVHFDRKILPHTSACIQKHNYTQHHSNMLLYICKIYQLFIVSDAVLCMLRIFAIVHRRGCVGGPRYWIDWMSQYELFVSWTSPSSS